MRWAPSLYANPTPIGKAGLPRDVAVADLFLASDEGHSVNCPDLAVDAGVTAGGPTNFADDTVASRTWRGLRL